MTWGSDEPGDPASGVRVVIDRSGPSPCLRLDYLVRTGGQQHERLSVPVGLDPAGADGTGSGGRLLCPQCGSGTETIYAPPGATGFACADCTGVVEPRATRARIGSAPR